MRRFFINHHWARAMIDRRASGALDTVIPHIQLVGRPERAMLAAVTRRFGCHRGSQTSR
jgi:hypothetical protein